MSALTHPHAPTGLSRYASDAATPCPPSPILTLWHTHCLPCLCSYRTLKICLQHCHPMSTFTHPYASTHCHLTCLCSHRTLKICLQQRHLISALTPATYHPYAPLLDQ
ncbi:hypothetical protein O181_022606 [Austropuccinia psidii MF-1]|uniref:Uncharacterized protein n=1 Tax=Austropuccinia psidii MF-1 TaxID=1389203 RepID=A0A9Q3GWV0_9BASI|nr:hypothetical protein [Austropuccinia psidii MF-1]